MRHRAAAALARRHGAMAEGAPHAERSAAVGDGDAVELLIAAGCAAVGDRPGEAARWFSSALELLDADDRERRLRLLGLLSGALEAADTDDRSGPAGGESHTAIQLGPSEPDPLAALSPREREVAELVAAGLRNRQIAERLFVSERTVEGHLSRIFPKLAITSRAALAASIAHGKATRHGLTQPGTTRPDLAPAC